MDLEFAAFLALDWGDGKHAWAMQIAGDPHRPQQGEIDNTPEAVEQWAGELAQRFGGRPIAVALEQSRGAVVAMLGKYEHLVLYPIHPTTLAHYRKGFYPSGAKDDPGDALIALELLVQHRDRLRVLRPDTTETRLLQFLVEGRRKLVEERTRLRNRFTDLLKQYFPQLLKWFGDSGSVVICDLLKRWPTLEALQKARPAAVLKFLQAHRCGDEQRRSELLRQIAGAVPATRDTALLSAAKLAAASLVRMLNGLRDDIAAYDRHIEATVKTHPDFPIVDSFPGVGPALAPRLIAACGTDRNRFQTARELQCFSGIAPVVESSGRQRWVHWRWACPKFVRQTFHEWAQHSLAKSVWARAYYHQQRARGKTHQAAVRALAFK
jgi:transposase